MPASSLTPGRLPRGLLMWAIAAAVLGLGAHSGDRGMAVQRDRLALMLGRDAALPGGCRYAGLTIDATRAAAAYQCGAERVSVELRPESGFAGSDADGARFAITVADGVPPAGLVDELTRRIRGGEAEIDWATASRRERPQAISRPDEAERLLARGLVVVLLGLAAQWLTGWRTRRRWPPRAALTVPAAAAAARGDAHVFRLALAAVVALFVGTRLWSLTCLPVFVDEASHIAWASDHSGATLVPQIVSGKWLPLQIIGAALRLPLPPLLAARLPAVGMGLISLAACLFVARRLFGRGAALAAGAVYTLLPFALFYERMVLADIYVAAFGAGVVGAVVAMAARPGSPAGLVLIACLAGAILSKPTGALFLAVPLLALLLVARRRRAAYLLNVLPAMASGAALLLVVLAGGFGTALMLGQSVDLDAELAHIPGNAALTWNWLTAWLTPAVAWAAVAAMAWALWRLLRGQRGEAFVAALILLAVLPYVGFAQHGEARYLVSIAMPVALLLGRALAMLAGRTAGALGARSPSARRVVSSLAGAALLGVVMHAALALDLALLSDPRRAVLPPTDRDQYIAGWAAGYGLPELAAWLREPARAQPLNVAYFTLSATLAEGLRVYLDPSADTAIHLHGLDADAPDVATALRTLAAERRTLFVSNRDEDPAQALVRDNLLTGATRVWTYERPDARSGIDVWEPAAASLRSVPSP